MSESPFWLAQVSRRCPEMTRTPRGWETCHRDEHPASEAHHVRDRSWYSLSDERRSPGLALGVPCGQACGWPEVILAYFGGRPGASTVTSWPEVKPRPRKSRAKPA